MIRLHSCRTLIGSDCLPQRLHHTFQRPVSLFIAIQVIDVLEPFYIQYSKGILFIRICMQKLLGIQHEFSVRSISGNFIYIRRPLQHLPARLLDQVHPACQIQDSKQTHQQDRIGRSHRPIDMSLNYRFRYHAHQIPVIDLQRLVIYIAAAFFRLKSHESVPEGIYIFLKPPHARPVILRFLQNIIIIILK